MSGEKILITEDERITALDLKMTLEKLGYLVVGSVASGEESIEYARRLKPDLVLMDIHLKMFYNFCLLNWKSCKII